FNTLSSGTTRIARGIHFVLKMSPISGTHLRLSCFGFSLTNTIFERATILTAFLNEKNRKRESCGFSWEKGNGGFPFVLIMNREDQI
ncbi:hypothetical protein, partial [Holdemania sp. 1001095H_141210_F2]